MRALLLALPLSLALACTKAPPPPATEAPPDTAEVVRFVALGDTGQGNDGQKQVAAAMHAKCEQSGCDFVTLLGDNIYSSGVSSVDDPQWQSKFEVPYAAFDIPFYAVLGNHDYGGNGAGNEPAKGQFEVDYSAKSTRWRMPAKFWHERVKNVELFGLDTNSALYEDDAKQRRDVAAWLAASDAPWKIALGHHPYLSNGPHGNAGSYEYGTTAGTIFDGHEVKALMDDVVCGKVDLYLCGHDHVKNYLEATCKGTQLAVSGTGSESTRLPGTNTARFQALTLGFAYVVAEPKKLTVEFYDVNGASEFSYSVEKQ